MKRTALFLAGILAISSLDVYKRQAGVHTKMIPDFGNVISTRPYIEDVQGIPAVSYTHLGMFCTCIQC